jgi:hypothetical protein
VQQQAQKETSASQALSDIRVPFSAGANVEPGTADALLKFAREHKGTQAAARALLVSAGIAFSQNTPAGYADAQQRFTQVLQEYPSSPWAGEANLGIAKALLAQGKTNEAIAKFEDLRTRFAKSGVADESKLSLARLLEAQSENSKWEDAFRIYDELMRSPMGGSMAMEASIRQEALLKKHPELAKLREPVAPPSAAMNPFQALSNRMTVVSNAASAAGSNFQRITLSTNRGGSTGQPMQIKLTPNPNAGANPSGANPPPPVSPSPAPAPAK